MRAAFQSVSSACEIHLCPGVSSHSVMSDEDMAQVVVLGTCSFVERESVY